MGLVWCCRVVTRASSLQVTRWPLREPAQPFKPLQVHIAVGSSLVRRTTAARRTVESAQTFLPSVLACQVPPRGPMRSLWITVWCQQLPEQLQLVWTALIWEFACDSIVVRLKYSWFNLIWIYHSIAGTVVITFTQVSHYNHVAADYSFIDWFVTSCYCIYLKGIWVRRS